MSGACCESDTHEKSNSKNNSKLKLELKPETEGQEDIKSEMEKTLKRKSPTKSEFAPSRKTIRKETKASEKNIDSRQCKTKRSPQTKKEIQSNKKAKIVERNSYLYHSTGTGDPDRNRQPTEEEMNKFSWCQECRKNEAVLKCLGCKKKLFCQECFDVVHRIRSKVSHLTEKLTPIEGR